MSDIDSQQQALKEDIHRTRRELVERIDELDGRLRRQLDTDRIAARHVATLSGAAAAAGLLVGLKAPKGILLAAGVAGAVLAARSAMERREEGEVRALFPEDVV